MNQQMQPSTQKQESKTQEILRNYPKEKLGRLRAACRMIEERRRMQEAKKLEEDLKKP